MKVIYPDTTGDQNKIGEFSTSNTTWCMASSMRVLGHDPMIIAPYLSDQYPNRKVRVRTYRISKLARRNIVGLIYNHIRLALEINTHCQEFDLIHTRDYLEAVILKRLCRLPVVVTPAGNPQERASKNLPYFDPITSRVYEVASKLVASGKSHVIASSKYMQKWWGITGVPSHRLTQIPLGVDTTLYSPRHDSRKRLGWSDNTAHLLYVGRLIPKLKGLETLISSMSTLNSSTDVHLHLVGDGAARNMLRKQIARLGLISQIHMYGWTLQKELPNYYSAADLCILPSHSEGFGRTMLECMSCGTAFLGTPVGGMKDHLVDGENGFVLAEVSNHEIAKKIESIFSDRQRLHKVAKNGHRYVVQNLAWTPVMKQVSEKVYASLLSP